MHLSGVRLSVCPSVRLSICPSVCSSVCLSQHGPTAANTPKLLLWPHEQEISIDCCTAGGQQQPRRNSGGQMRAVSRY